jgi:hypothetical protein
MQVRTVPEPVPVPAAGVAATLDEMPRSPAVAKVKPPPVRVERPVRGGDQARVPQPPRQEAPQPDAVMPAAFSVEDSAPAALQDAVLPDLAESVSMAALPSGLMTVADAGPASSPEVPRYRTKFPPPITLSYELSSGFLSGTGELVWLPAAGRYELRLEGRVVRMRVITQVSSGAIDANGLAPTRFTDRRRRGSERAANFQRDKGTITFSGSQAELPLVPGAQDRLSWMVQLPAIINAEPARLVPGERVQFYLVSARGDGDMWAFRFVGMESVRTEAGTVRAAKFVREPGKPYDTLVEVWLDPSRYHLPARARLTTMPERDTLELLFKSASAPS